MIASLWVNNAKPALMFACESTVLDSQRKFDGFCRHQEYHNPKPGAALSRIRSRGDRRSHLVAAWAGVQVNLHGDSPGEPGKSVSEDSVRRSHFRAHDRSGSAPDRP